MPKIILQRNKCVGCGSCAIIAPDYWEISSEDGLAILKGSEENDGTQVLIIDDDKIEINKEAAESCSMEAITIVDDNMESIV